MALFDNEEIGSASTHGAASNMMPQTIERILACSGLGNSVDAVQRAYRQSFLISADMAHCIHPNYPYVPFVCLLSLSLSLSGAVAHISLSNPLETSTRKITSL